MTFTITPDLPEGWTLDPACEQILASKNLWWVITDEGTRTCWGPEANVMICPACTADQTKMAECPECKGRGIVDHVPFAIRPWDEVVPGLWLGGHDCQPCAEAPTGDCYPGSTFDMVVSLYQRYGDWNPHPGVVHLTYRMHDADLDPLHYTRLDELATHVEDAVRHGDKVLVRCQAGLNRAALITGLAMLKMGWSADDAIARMREVRGPYVLFNASFVAYLRQKDRP